MSAFIKFRPSGSQDVVSYNLYHKLDEQDNPLTKDNSNPAIDLGNPAPDAEGFIVVELNVIPELASLDGMYDLGVAAVDDAGNISPMLTTGLADISLDFLAPSPPSEASVFWS